MHELDTIARRLDALDKENRRLKQLLVLAAIIVAAAAAIRTQAAAATVTADRLVLVDAQNRARATFEMSAPLVAGTSYPVLTFLDAAGKPRLRLGLAARGPMLELVDENGKTRDYLAPAGPRPLTQP
jgi:hypothetical protein